MAQLFESRGFGRGVGFRAGRRRTPRRSAIWIPRASDLEGYLFPDTYAMPRHATAAQLVARMVDGFEKALTPELARARRARGLTSGSW